MGDIVSQQHCTHIFLQYKNWQLRVDHVVKSPDSLPEMKQKHGMIGPLCIVYTTYIIIFLIASIDG